MSARLQLCNYINQNIKPNTESLKLGHKKNIELLSTTLTEKRIWFQRNKHTDMFSELTTHTES